MTDHKIEIGTYYSFSKSLTFLNLHLFHGWWMSLKIHPFLVSWPINQIFIFQVSINSIYKQHILIIVFFVFCLFFQIRNQSNHVCLSKLLYGPLQRALCYTLTGLLVNPCVSIVTGWEQTVYFLPALLILLCSLFIGLSGKKSLFYCHLKGEKRNLNVNLW